MIDEDSGLIGRAIRELAPDAFFNVIFYHHRYMIWKSDGVALATPANKLEAIKFVEELEPAGATNIFTPLEKGFNIRSSDPRLKGDVKLGAFRGGVDTIYLLSDGVSNQGQIKDTTKI